MDADGHPRLLDRIASVPVWYHVLELGPGAVTPGWFDLRPIVDHLPWPAVEGLRCLDIGTYDGFLAFELERRGASEVVAIDIDDHRLWDWPPTIRASAGDDLAKLVGAEKGVGFRVAAEALGSSVTRLPISIYDLDPADVGMFDVVVCGSLLLHLRDPLRALQAVRGVCGGVFLSCEAIDLPLTLAHPRRPVARLDGVSELCQWWTPTAAGHLQMLRAGGFTIDRSIRPYAVPFGPSHPRPGRDPRSLVRVGLQRLIGGPGVPHAAALARPLGRAT